MRGLLIQAGSSRSRRSRLGRSTTRIPRTGCPRSSRTSTGNRGTRIRRTCRTRSGSLRTCSRRIWRTARFRPRVAACHTMGRRAGSRRSRRRWSCCRWSCSSRSYVVALSLTGRVTLARATRPTCKPDRRVGSRVVSALRTHGSGMARMAGAKRRTGGGLRGSVASVTMGPGRSNGPLESVCPLAGLASAASSRGRLRRHVGVAAADLSALGRIPFPRARTGGRGTIAGRQAGRWLEGWVAAWDEIIRHRL